MLQDRGMGSAHRRSEVCFHIRSEGCALGRRTGIDIILWSPSISRIQCSFEINEKSNIVMLHDRPSRRSTRVSGDSSPCEHEHPRQIAVKFEFNNLTGIGGKRDLYIFKLV